MKKLLYLKVFVVLAIVGSTSNAEQSIQDFKPIVLKQLSDIKQALKTLNGVNRVQIQKNFAEVIDKATTSIHDAFADTNNSAKFKIALDAVQILQNDWVNLYQTDPAAVSKTTFEFKIATAKAQNTLSQAYAFVMIKNGLDKLLYDAFAAVR